MRGNRSTLRFESLEIRRMLASNSVEVPVHVLSEVGTTRLDPPLSSGVSGLYSAKLNDDLFPDLIATSFGGLEVLYGDGQGSFEVHQHYDAITRGLGQIEFGDLNNDGRMDWIAHGEDLMRVFVSQADGDWEWTDLPIEPGISVALGQIDDDGIPDLVRHVGTGDIHVHVGKGDGTFKDSVAYAVNAPASGRTVVHRLIGDLNQDGFDDIVRRTQLLSSTSGTTTEVLLNDGSGHFEITLSTGVENSPYALVDLNGDGKLDLMTSDYRFHGGIFGESLNFTTHLGNGDGTFSDAKTIFSVNRTAEDLSFGDVNHDGNIDIVVFDTVDNHIQIQWGTKVILGNGDGTFQRGFYALRETSGSVVLDVDADGTDEFAVVLPPDGSERFLSVRKLVEPTEFAAVSPSYSFGGEAYRRLVEDVNGDEIPDFVTATVAFEPTEMRWLDRIAIQLAHGNGFLDPIFFDIELSNDFVTRLDVVPADADGTFHLSVGTHESHEILLPVPSDLHSLNHRPVTVENAPRTRTTSIVWDETFVDVASLNGQPETYIVPRTNLPIYSDPIPQASFFDWDFDGDLDYLQPDSGGFFILWGIGKGDVNRDGKRNGLDVTAIRTSEGVLEEFDLNADEVVDERDVQHLVEDIGGTRLGDADFDGRVDFIDFLALANNFGKQDSVWDEGDFDGDGTVGFDDFLMLAQNFGFDGEMR